jgi:ribose transport system substrate-binding protein
LRFLAIEMSLMEHSAIRKAFVIFAALLEIILAFLTGACQPRQTSAKPTIALVMKSLANEFFLNMENGARAHEEKNQSYSLLANGIKDELDVSRQIDLVEQMIARPVSALVIAPADSKALVAVCKKAVQSGIVVVNIDNKFDAAVLRDKQIHIPFVGPDNRKGARLAGEFLAATLKRGDKVAILEGVPNAFNGVQRKLGFDDAVAKFGLTTVSSQSAGWESAKANLIVSALIAEQPNLQGIFCANDSMALGAVAGLRAAGKSDQVKVVGFDNISAIRQLVKEGKVLATVDQHGDQLAVYGIEYALEMLKTKTPPADRETPVDLVTAETLAH